MYVSDLIEPTVSVLVHPCQAARLAAAWCLRCICVAVPSQITPLVDRCVSGIEELRTSPEAISGRYMDVIRSDLLHELFVWKVSTAK